MANITIVKPQAGTTLTIDPQESELFVLDFNAADATLTREGDNLIISFEDASAVNLTDFYDAYNAENMPAFIVEGTEVSGEDFFATLGEELMPAAGISATQNMSGGSGVDTVTTSLQGGLDSLKGLDQAHTASTSELSEAQNVTAASAAVNVQRTRTLSQQESAEDSKDTDATNDYVPPKISVSIKGDDDGVVSKDDLAGSNADKVQIEVTLEEGVEAGDEVVIKKDNEVIETVIVTDDMIENGITVWVDPPEDGELNVEATVTTEEGFIGKSETSTVIDTTPPSISIELDDITADNIINAAEAGSIVNVTGRVEGEVNVGDRVTISVNGKDYFGTVGNNGEFTIPVLGSDLAADNDVSASITVSDKAGNTATATDKVAYEVDTEIGGDRDGQVSSDDGDMAQEVVVDGIELPDDVSYNFEGDSLTVGDADNPLGTFSFNTEGQLVFTQNQAYQHDENSDMATKVVQIPVKDTSGNEGFVDITINIADTAPEMADDSTNTEFNSVDGVASGSLSMDFGADMDGASITLSGAGTVKYSVTWDAEDGQWKAADGSTENVSTSYDGDVYTIQIGDVTMTSTDNKNWDVSFPHESDGNRDVKLSFTDGDGDSISHTITALDTTPPSISITLDDITSDNTINATEAGGTVNVTGRVEGDVKAGDKVTISVNNKDYSGTVGENGEFSIPVLGSDLAAGDEVSASITVVDKAGNESTATDKAAYDVDTVIGGDLDGQVSSDDGNMAQQVVVDGIDLPDDASYNIVGDSLTVGDADNPLGTFSFNTEGQLVFTQNQAYQHDANSDSATEVVQIPVKDASGNEGFVDVTITIGDSAPQIAGGSTSTEFDVTDGIASGNLAVDFGGDMDGASITLAGAGTVKYSVTWDAEDGQWKAADGNSQNINTSYDGDVYTIQIGDVTMTSTDNQNWDVSFPHDSEGSRDVKLTFTDGDGDKVSHTLISNTKPSVGDVTDEATLSEGDFFASTVGFIPVRGEGSVELDFGSEGGETFAWNSEDQPQIFTSNGTEVTWTVEGDTLVGTANGEEVLSVTMQKDGNGNYTGDYNVTLSQPIEHDGVGQDSAELNFGFTIGNDAGLSTSGSVSVSVEDSTVSLTAEAENLHMKAGDSSTKFASDYFDEGAERSGGEFSVLGANQVTEIEDGTVTYDFDWGSVNMNPETGEYTVEGNGSGDGEFGIQFTDADGDSAQTTVQVENSIVVVDISIDSVQGFVGDGTTALETGMVTVHGTIFTVDTTNEENTMTVKLEYGGKFYETTAVDNGDGTYSYSTNIPSDAILDASGEIKIDGDGIKTTVEIKSTDDEPLANDTSTFSYSYFNKAADADAIVGTNNTDIIEGVIVDTDSVENQTNATNIGSATGKTYNANIDTAAGDDVLSFNATGAHAYNVVSLGSNTVTLDTGTGDDSLSLYSEGTKAGAHGVVGIKAEGDSAQNIIDMGAGDDKFELVTDGVSGFKFAIVARDKNPANGTETFNKIDMGSGDDTVYIEGEIEGDNAKNLILTGDGDDVMTAVGGKNATYSEHTFEATKANGVNEVDLGAGNDVLNIQNDGTFGGGYWSVDSSNRYGDALNANDSGTNIIKLGTGDDALNIDGDIYAYKNANNTMEMGDGDDNVSIDGNMDANWSSTNTIDLGAGNDNISIDGQMNADSTSDNIIKGGEGDDTFSAVGFTAAAKAYLDGGEGYDAFIYETSDDSYIDFSQAGSIAIGGADNVRIDNFESVSTGEGSDLIYVGSNLLEADIDSGAGFDIVVASGDVTDTDMSELLNSALNTEMFIFSNDADVTGATSTEEALDSLKGVEQSENGEFVFDANNWTQGESSTHNGTEFHSFTDNDGETTIMIAKAMLENTST